MKKCYYAANDGKAIVQVTTELGRDSVGNNTIRTGQAPNLPWWRLERMTEEEIEKFNDGFMKEEEMGSNVEPERTVKAMQALSVFEKDIWNEAIEAAALRAERSYQHKTIADAIRKLKK